MIPSYVAIDRCGCWIGGIEGGGAGVVATGVAVGLEVAVAVAEGGTWLPPGQTLYGIQLAVGVAVAVG